MSRGQGCVSRGQVCVSRGQGCVSRGSMGVCEQGNGCVRGLSGLL